MDLRGRDVKLSSYIKKNPTVCLGEISVVFLWLAHHNRRKVGVGWESGAHSFEAFLELVTV